MLDIGWSEMAVIALLALVIIGPRDLPRVMRTMGKWAHKARSISREFQSGIDEMVREADLEDAKKAMQTARSGGLNKIVEDTIDPTGSIKAEAKDLQQVTQGVTAQEGASQGDISQGNVSQGNVSQGGTGATEASSPAASETSSGMPAAQGTSPQADASTGLGAEESSAGAETTSQKSA